MTASAPRVSVVMPVYNADRFLSKAIGSVLAQSFADFEVLAIDDGSSDNSRAILEKCAAKDSRVQVISRPNKGLSATLNEGVKLARGAYIARMDADDVAFPNRFATQVVRMDAELDLVVLGTQVEIIDTKGRPIRQTRMPLDHDTIVERHASTMSPQLYHPSTLIRAEALHAVGGYREAFAKGEDFDLWLRLEERGRLANCAEVLLQYRVHVESVSARNSEEQLRLAWQAAREAAERRGRDFCHPYPTATKNHAKRHAELYRKWGWWALQGGNIPTARLYAWRALCREPIATEAWRLAVCSMRGY